MSIGALVERTGDHYQAWSGVRVAAASDLTRQREYTDLAEEERFAKAVQNERVWLSRFFLEQAMAWELRWLTDGAGGLGLYVLSRVVGATEAVCSDAITRSQQVLAAAPQHVRLEPIEDASEVRRLLHPFDVAPAGVARITKRCVTGKPTRPDAEVGYYFAIQPFRSTPNLWPMLIRSLSLATEPTMFSVGLRPTQVESNLPDVMTSIASSYERLAERGQPKGATIYEASPELGPEAFAIDAKDLYLDAARRLRGDVFEIRVSVHSAAPLDAGLLSVLSTTIGGAERTGAGDSVSAPFRGSAAVVRSAATNDEVSASLSNTARLDFHQWGEHEVWFRRDPPHPVLRRAVHLVDVEEALAAFRLPVAVNGRLDGIPVEVVDLDVAAVHRAIGPTVRLGTQLAGAGQSLDVAVNELTTHAFYVGTTGAGKSTGVMSLLEQLWLEHRIPFLAIEPVNSTRNDYRRFLSTPGFEDALLLTAGNESLAPLRLNPLEVPAGTTVGEHLSNVLSAFDAAFGLFDPLPALYREALTKTYAEAGFHLGATGDADFDWPTIRELQVELARVVRAQRYQGEVASNIEAASLVRLRQLASGPAGSVLNCRRSLPFDVLMHRPVVVELAHLGVAALRDQALIIALLLTTMTEYLGRTERDAGMLNHVTVIEEAHRLLKRAAPTAQEKGDASEAASELFSNLLAEVRKHGEGIVIVDQDPAKLVPDTYKNTNLKVMFRLPYEEDRAVLGSAMSFDDDHLRASANLNPFEAFAHVGSMDRPAHIRSTGATLVERDHPRTEIVDDDEVAARFSRLRRGDERVERTIAPFAACSGCTEMCRHREVSAAVALRDSARERFIDAAASRPLPPDDLGPDELEVAPDWPSWHERLHADLADELGQLDHEPTTGLVGCTMMHLAMWQWPEHDVGWLVSQHRASLVSP